MPTTRAHVPHPLQTKDLLGGIQRVSKEKCRSIDDQQLLRHKRLDREHIENAGTAMPAEAGFSSWGLMKFTWKTTQRVKYRARAFALFVGLLGSVMLHPSRAYAQAEIEPDHFDSPNAQPTPQLVRLLRYDGTFSLPYSVLCNGKKLAPGKYSVSLRFDGKVGRATLNQKNHAIEIASVVQMEAPKQHDEVVVVENNQTGRTLSVIRVSGFDFVLDPKLSADPSDGSPAWTKKLSLKRIVRNEIATQVPSLASPKP